MYKIILLLILVNMSLLSQTSENSINNNSQLPDDKLTGMQYISKDNLMKTVEYLASLGLKGRLSGSPGYNTASEFVAKEMKRLGLKTINNEGYYQHFNIEYNEIVSPAHFSVIDVDGKSKEYKLGDDYVFRGFTGSGNITSDVVFCGYGMTIPGYNDYQGVDVKGKIVMAFKYAPAWKLNDATVWTGSSIRDKIKNASDRGALAILFVSTPKDAKPQKPIISVLEGTGVQNETFPSLHIALNAADNLLNGSGYTLKDLQSIIDSIKTPFPLTLKSKAHVEANAKYTKEQPTQNIVGILEGSDPLLKDEYIVIGAQLDHVGSQATIYAPGANDNASGSAAVLEIMRSFVDNKIKTRRSIIFTLFACEEIGLNGAKHFVNNPPVPLNKIKGMINIDCIGAGDSLQVGGKKEYPNLWNIADSINRSSGLSIMVDLSFGPGADAAPFHEKGIPSLYFATTNGYTDLHLPTDIPAHMNKELYERSVRIAFLTAYDLLNRGNMK